MSLAVSPTSPPENVIKSYEIERSDKFHSAAEKYANLATNTRGWQYPVATKFLKALRHRSSGDPRASDASHRLGERKKFTEWARLTMIDKHTIRDDS